MNLKIKSLQIVFFIFSFLILPLSLSGQITFERYYGEPSAYGTGKEVFQKNDGGYIFAGSTQFSGTDIYFYLVRTDSLGDTLWTRFYGGIQTEYGHAMDTTSDGGYIIIGSTNSFGAGDYDVYVVRTDSLGDTLWTRSYGGPFEDVGFSIKQIPDGGFIIAGRTNSYGAGGFDAYLIRINSFGDTLWTRTYGDSLDDYAASVEITSDSCFVITGTTWSFGPTNLYFIKIDFLGNVLWERRFGGQEYTEGYAVRQIIDGGYIITGEIYIFMEATTYIYLIKTDSLGDSLWAKNIGLDYGTGDEDHAGYSVEQTTDGGYIITGYAQAWSSTDTDLFLVKTNEYGDTLWTRLYGGTSLPSETGYSVKETIDGGYIISGHSDGGGHGQAYLIKTDGQGNVAVQEKPYYTHLTDTYLRCTPNPFTSEVRIQISDDRKTSDIGPLSSELHLQIYDISGRVVKKWILPAPYSLLPTEVTWDGRDQYGDKVCSGVYFVVLQINQDRFSEKLILLQ